MAGRPHSVFEMREKLAFRSYEKFEIDETIAILLEAGHLNDSIYCRSYAEARIKRMRLGPQRIKTDLKRKGFDETLINETLSELFPDDDVEMSVALEAAEKKARYLNNDMDEKVIKRKLYDHLTRRGFSPEIARRVALDQFATVLAGMSKLYG
ncbi:MAG TPA: regulatory protein RecX [Nitrospirae bacterium]|nr:regulatory protein RecX [Nitrospirota bacterium]